MSENVIPLNERARICRDETPSQDIIDVLETALAQARSGELRAIALAKVIQQADGERVSETAWRSFLSWQTKDLVFSLRWISDELMDLVRQS